MKLRVPSFYRIRPSRLFVAIVLTCTVCISNNAKAQDAMAAFLFLFIDNTVDVSVPYGDTYTTKYGDTVSLKSRCIFERRWSADNFERFELDKAFFAEAKPSSYFANAVNWYRISIPGEKGFFSRRAPGGHVDYDVLSTDPLTDELRLERVEKALRYFEQNFCPGTTRKTAF